MKRGNNEWNSIYKGQYGKTFEINLFLFLLYFPREGLARKITFTEHI